MRKIIELVDNNICSGCGICVSVCPRKCFEIQFTDSGQYRPIIPKERIADCIDCHICSKSCGFLTDYQVNRNTKYDFHIGEYYSTYSAYVTDDKLRLKSASGGVATQLLKSLIKNNIVNYVVCVRQVANKHPLIKPVICKTEDEIDACSGSFYYPVEYSDIIRYILLNDGRYAIVGLPCVLRSIENAKSINKKLKERILITIGLVCGSNKNAAHTDFLLKKYGNQETIHSINFRLKLENTQSSSINFQFNHDKKLIIDNKQWGKYWSLGAFNLKSCSYCTDVFAEKADIVLMDAWKYPYVNDYKGTNFVVIRNKVIDNLFRNLTDCQIEPVDIQDIVYSQKYFASPIIDKQHNNLYNKNKYSSLLYKDRFEYKRIGLLAKLQLTIKNKSQELVYKNYKLNNKFDFIEFEKKLNKMLMYNQYISLFIKVKRKLQKIVKK